MVKYHVDAENGIVVASLEGVEYDAACVINKYLGGSKMSVDEVKELKKQGANIAIFEDNRIKNKYVGVARCHADDTFDEEKGKEIARKRMLIKYNKDKSEVICRNLYELSLLMENLERADDKIWDRIEDLDSEIDAIAD